MTIHKEGYKSLIITLIVLFVLNLAVLLFVENIVWHYIVIWGSILFFITILQFFRSPRIVTEKNAKHIIAPADGKVVVIEEAEEKEYFRQRKLQVSIFMSPVNVHVNRNPVSGIIRYFKYHPGKYLVAWHPKASTENERTTLVYEVESGIQILIRQIAGAMARRIRCYINEGHTVDQGAEFGFIKFGSRVDIFLPLDAEVMVKIGETTKAGKTVIAVLK